MKPTLSPYLNFMGKAGEAMKFYQSVLGGELFIQTYGETGQGKPEEKDYVMHAALKSDVGSFFASDGNEEHQVHMGDNVHLSIMGNDEVTLTKWFNSLAEGGTIDMPLAKQFWGDTFGMLTDKFGIHWMVNISGGQNE